MPATAPNSYLANTLDYAIEMLCQSATFRTLVGAASVALARGFIINTYGGNPVQAGGQGRTTFCDGVIKARPTSYAILAPDAENAHRQEQIAFREFAHSGRINLVVVTVTTANESAESIIVRGTNLMETIAAELIAQLGIAGRLIGADFDTKGPSLPDETGSKRATFDFLITIDWRDSA